MVELKLYLSTGIRLRNFTDLLLLLPYVCTQSTLFLILSFPLELITSIMSFETGKAIYFLIILFLKRHFFFYVFIDF